MKKIILILTAIIVATIGRGQSFDGTIRIVTKNFWPQSLKEEAKKTNEPLPDSVTTTIIKLKGGNAAIIEEGMTLMYIGETHTTYHINHKRKSYAIIATPKLVDSYDVTKTPDTANILGHLCTKYIVKLNSPALQYANDLLPPTLYWATEELSNIDYRALDSWAKIPGIPGFILRTEMRAVDSSITEASSVSDVVEIKQEILPDSDFSLPPDYTNRTKK